MNVFDFHELRERGLSDQTLFPEEKLKVAEIRVWALIELICNQFFEPRSFGSSSTDDYAAMQLDGSGTSILYLPVPIISLSSLLVDTASISASNIVTYNRVYPMVDDRRNPKLKLKAGSFNLGDLNIEISGTFGYVDVDGKPPRPLIDAAMKIMLLEYKPLVGKPSWRGGPVKGSLVSEISDRYMYKLDVGEVINGFTGVAEIDKVLFLYRRDVDSIRGRVI